MSSRLPSMPVQIIRNAYSGTNITTGAYVQLTSATTEKSTMMEIYDGSGKSLKIAIGASGSEVDVVQIMPGGNGQIPFHLEKGTRLSAKALSADATTGELLINLYY